MKTTKDKKTCPNCGTEFMPRRDNMRFCKTSCRIEFNNTKNNTKRKILAKKSRPLAINYDILNKILNGKKEKIVHRQYLRGAGFNFSVFTHADHNLENNYPCYGCHEFRYYKIDNEHYKIIRND